MSEAASQRTGYALSYHVQSNPNKKLSYNPSAWLVQAAALGTIILIGSAIAHLGLVHMHSIGIAGEYCLHGAMGVGGAIILANMALWSVKSFKRSRVGDEIAQEFIELNAQKLNFESENSEKMYTKFENGHCTSIWIKDAKGLRCEVFYKADPNEFIAKLHQTDYTVILPKSPE